MLTLKCANYNQKELGALQDALEEAMSWLVHTEQNEGPAYYDLYSLRDYVLKIRNRAEDQKPKRRRTQNKCGGRT